MASCRPLGLFCDIDGTLAPIATTPDATCVPPRVLRLLQALARRLDLLALVSGRSLKTVRQLAPCRGITYVGNHGLERWYRGRRHLAPGAAPWRRLMTRALKKLAATPLPTGVLLESKGLTLGIHYRLCPDPQEGRRQILQALVRLSLAGVTTVTEQRKMVELRPTLPVHKGTAVETLIVEHRLHSAIYLGDDATDLDAFRTLRQLEQAARCRSLKVAVRSEETPEDLLSEADYVVSGTLGALEFLEALQTTLG